MRWNYWQGNRSLSAAQAYPHRVGESSEQLNGIQGLDTAALARDYATKGGGWPILNFALFATVARAHLEEDGRVLLHRRFIIDDKGEERMMIELRMTRK